MSEQIISEWSINAREKMRVRLDTYQGHNIIDLRRWYSDGKIDHKPGRGGLTMSVKHLPALAAAVNAALSQAVAAGLLPPMETKTS
jgi:hypothetical protein